MTRENVNLNLPNSEQFLWIVISVYGYLDIRLSGFLD
jgi:hypothetical protein